MNLLDYKLNPNSYKISETTTLNMKKKESAYLYEFGDTNFLTQRWWVASVEDCSNKNAGLLIGDYLES